MRALLPTIGLALTGLTLCSACARALSQNPDIAPTPPHPTSAPATGQTSDDPPSTSTVIKPETYRFGSGLTVEIPLGWSISEEVRSEGYEGVWIRAQGKARPTIGVEVYDRPQVQRDLADPYNWQPNEGGYEVHWPSPVDLAGLPGTLFVWGALRSDGWELAPWIMAVAYDPDRALDVRLTTEFLASGIEHGNELDLLRTLASEHSDYGSVLSRLYFGSEMPSRELRGVLRRGEKLGEVKSYCPQGIYLVADGDELLQDGQMLLLRIATSDGRTELYSNAGLLGQRVQVSGNYPAQEVFCEALTCECEDYILVREVANQP